MDQYETFVTGWDEVAERHKGEDPLAWNLATGLVGMHVLAVRALNERANESGRFASSVAVLIGTNALSVFAATLGHIYRGEFAVSDLLARPLFDASALLFCCVADDLLALRYWSGDLTAAEARRAAVPILAKWGKPKAAEALAHVPKSLRDGMNQYAHLNVVHGLHALDSSGDDARASFSGRYDSTKFRLALSGAISSEFMVLGVWRLASIDMSTNWNDHMNTLLDMQALWTAHDFDWDGVDPR